MIKILATIALFAFGFICFGSGLLFGQSPSQYQYVYEKAEVVREVYIPVPVYLTSTSKLDFDSPITVEQARHIIEMARSTHYYYTQHPEKIQHGHGIEYELMWVKRYQQLDQLILRLESKGENK